MSGRRSVCNITPDTGAYQYYVYLGLWDIIKIDLLQLIVDYFMGLDMRKPVFGSLRTTPAQTSLRIRAV